MPNNNCYRNTFGHYTNGCESKSLQDYDKFSNDIQIKAKFIYPAMQVQWKVNTAPFSSITAHSKKGVADVLWECFT